MFFSAIMNTVARTKALEVKQSVEFVYTTNENLLKR